MVVDSVPLLKWLQSPEGGRLGGASGIAAWAGDARTLSSLTLVCVAEVWCMPAVQTSDIHPLIAATA